VGEPWVLEGISKGIPEARPGSGRPQLHPQRPRAS